MTRYQSLVTFALLVALSSLTACEELAAPELATAPSAATAEAPTPTGGVAPHEWVTDEVSGRVDPYDLYLGTSAELPGGRSVSFDDLGPDSRCPIGVDCVRPGEVTARFTVTTPDGSTPIELTLPGGEPAALPLQRAPWASVDSLLVYLVRLAPYPVASSDGDDVADAIRQPEIFDPAPPQATLVVRPCPNTGEGCVGGTGDGSNDA